MATAADGTHPTGMHSCFATFLPKLHENEKNWTAGRPWHPLGSATENFSVTAGSGTRHFCSKLALTSQK